MGCIIAATIWALSQIYGSRHPKDFFQPRGILWRPMAGAMVVLLYIAGERRTAP